MDKELLRVVIIATGLLIIMGMLAWHFLKNKKFSQGMGFFAEQDYTGNINESLVINDDFDGRDDFEITPVEKSAESVASLLDDVDNDFEFDDEMVEPIPRFVAPDIIQFSVVAKTAQGFNGLDLFKAFQIAQLEYGSLKIFERLDANRRVDFGVACLVEPGTFPNSGLEAFFCPGIVFFMQPGLLDDAPKLFNDFLEAVNIVAVELDGDILDHQREPLTNATIQLIRESL